jgi:hypothetical protein
VNYTPRALNPWCLLDDYVVAACRWFGFMAGFGIRTEEGQIYLGEGRIKNPSTK